MAKKFGKRAHKAAVDQVREIYLDYQMKLFSDIEKSRPEIAAVLKSDYEKFLEADLERARQDPKGETRLSDTIKLLPDNLWGQVLKKSLEGLTKGGRPVDEKRGRREFRSKIAQDLKGKKRH